MLKHSPGMSTFGSLKIRVRVAGEVGGDFDHRRMCVGKEPDATAELFPRASAEARIMMIRITKNCDCGHRNTNSSGLD
jgi:hypothetical protein